MKQIIQPRKSLLSTAIAAACLQLAACGGGGGGGGGGNTPATPQTLTGVFGGGNITGLHFETATQSGETNSAGEYTYRAGETITFSIGGVELGSVAAKAAINPFDFSAMTIPTDYFSYENTYWQNQDPEAMSLEQRDILKAMLITHFIYAFDDDFDLTNGIDVSNANLSLTTANQIDFTNHDYHENFEALSRDTQLGNANLYPIAAMSVLLEDMNITLSIPAITTRVLDDDIDGVIDERSNYEFDVQNFSIVTQEDLNGDNTVDSIRNQQVHPFYFFDLSQETQKDNDFDGVFDDIRTSTSTHDSKGFLTNNYRTVDLGGNGTIDAISETTTVWDTQNYVKQSQLNERDDDNDGSIDYSNLITYQYNADFDTSNIHHDRDDDGDTVSDFLYNVAYTRDSDGNILTEFREYDDDGNGLVDRTRLYENEYDSQGNVVFYKYESDNDNDGVIDSGNQRSYQYQYDTENRIIQEVTHYDDDMDNSSDRIYTSTWTYDTNGNRTNYTESRDSDADGNADSLRTVVSLYNADTLLIQETSSRDNDMDGFDDYVEVRTRAYNADQNLTHSQTLLDSDGDGAYDSNTEYTYTWLEKDVVQSRQYEKDGDMDGVFETSWLTTYEFTTLEAPLLYLLYIRD